MKSVKIRNIIIILMLIFVVSGNVYANDWWTKATGFFNGGTASSLTPLNELKNIIQAVGNMIFIVVTVILGIKYIWGGIDAKASIKENLITLVVAAIAFYSWTTIEQLFMNGNKLVFLTGTAEQSAANIYSTIIYICNFLAIGGIVYIGVRYLMAGAEGKAALKAKSIPIILGIIMVYATLEFLNLAISIV